MPSKTVRERMQQQPARAKYHCAQMRSRKELYALRRLTAAYEAKIGKPWNQGIAEHFGIQDSIQARAAAGLLGKGFERVESHMRETVES